MSVLRTGSEESVAHFAAGGVSPLAKLDEKGKVNILVTKFHQPFAN